MFDRVLGRWLVDVPTGALRERVLRELSRYAAITPGDFAAVARRLSALQRRCTADELLNELRAELVVKEGPGRAIGF
jgi:hypothetical protein